MARAHGAVNVTFVPRALTSKNHACVCPRFTNAAAEVACRQLGFSGGLALCCSRYGPQQQGLLGGVGGGGNATSITSTSSGDSSGPAGSGALPGAPAAFHLDEVVCAGSEASLAACEHNAWGFHDCGSGEAVAVRCSALAGAAANNSASGTNSTNSSSGVAQPYSNVGPAIRCLASGSDRTGNCTDVGPVYFYYGGGTTEVEYRVVYRYANGVGARCQAGFGKKGIDGVNV